MSTRHERIESVVQVIILLLVGSMAGAASFTHVHDWTMTNSPTGTGDWFGWANAVISELTPAAAGLEIRRRKRHNQHVGYPMAVLITAACVSIAAQLAVAKPGPTGWLLAAVPALAFLALSKLVLSRTTPLPVITTVEPGTAVQVTAQRPAIDQHHTPNDPATTPVQVPAGLLTGARMAIHHHEHTTGHPITADGLADQLNITPTLAAAVLRDLGHHDGIPTPGSRP